MDEFSKELVELYEAIDKLAEQYATDVDGQFDNQAYMAFKAGFTQGLDIALQLFQAMKSKPDSTQIN